MVVRADREHRGPVNGQTEALIITAVKAAIENAHALVVSDYDKGVVTPRVLAEVLPFAYGRIPVLIDPKLRNFDAYRPATLITPNHFEALRMAGLEEDSDTRIRRRGSPCRSTTISVKAHSSGGAVYRRRSGGPAGARPGAEVERCLGPADRRREQARGERDHRGAGCRQVAARRLQLSSRLGCSFFPQQLPLFKAAL